MQSESQKFDKIYQSYIPYSHQNKNSKFTKLSSTSYNSNEDNSMYRAHVDKYSPATQTNERFEKVYQMKSKPIEGINPNRFVSPGASEIFRSNKESNHQHHQSNLLKNQATILLKTIKTDNLDLKLLQEHMIKELITSQYTTSKVNR